MDSRLRGNDERYETYLSSGTSGALFAGATVPSAAGAAPAGGAITGATPDEAGVVVFSVSLIAVGPPSRAATNARVIDSRTNAATSQKIRNQGHAEDQRNIET